MMTQPDQDETSADVQEALRRWHARAEALVMAWLFHSSTREVLRIKEPLVDEWQVYYPKDYAPIAEA